MNLFKTTASVFEPIWDFVIAFYIVRLAFFYFGLSFLTSCIIGYFRVFNVAPLSYFTHHQSALITLLFWIMTFCFWARFLIVAYETPRVGVYRLAIGGLTFILMLIAELATGIFMYEKCWKTWIWETNMIVTLTGSIVLVVFALMPLLLMGFTTAFEAQRKTIHGHEKKSITAAI